MKITINGLDYSAVLDAALPLKIERRLNEPSVCEFLLSVPASGELSAPTRNQAVAVVGEDGTVYFTGYVAASPVPEYCGMTMEGPRYRMAVRAVSDEVLLDQVLVAPSAGATGQSAGALMRGLVEHSGSTALSTTGLALDTPVSHFAPASGAAWSKNAGEIANHARAAYRAVNGALSLVPVQSTVHPLNESDGTLTLAGLSLTANAKRALANDVAVCGEHEPIAYVTEYFSGDGVTTQFDLAEAPFFLPAAKSTIVRERFNESAINASVWSVLDSGGYFSLGGGGLSMKGGKGVDGQTVLQWIDSVEMGGTLLLEATGVTLAANSSGILAGFFANSNTASGCVAGFQVVSSPGSGAVTVQPFLQGAAAGTSFAIHSANQYTLRMRLHCAEDVRAQAIYRSFGDSGAIAVGGSSDLAAGNLQMEIQEFANGVGAMPVTLYDGAIANLPAACSLLAASAILIFGTMRGINLTNLGSAWVVSTPAAGGAYTRRLGTTGEAGECMLDRSGKLVFYASYQPAVAERFAVSYRTVGRAVGRAVNAASQASLAESGLPITAAWIGSVASPAARCSADCRNAAQAIAQAAAGTSAALNGSYKATRADFAADVWPGDALALTATSADLNAQVVVRAVTLSYRASMPDLVEYAIAFANDWANDLAIRTRDSVPSDAWLPVPTGQILLANLNALRVTALSGTSLSINTGTAPPVGGGFEVRRRDFGFMPGEDPDLVARITTQSFIIARQTANDRFYIRMFDGATPPNYSEFSAAIFVNLPVGS